MTLSYLYNGSAITHDIAPSTASITGAAENGETAQSGLVIEDPDADLELLGHRPFVIEESACSQPRLFTGWTTERAIGRIVEDGLHGDATSRGLDTTIVDVNALFNFRLLSGTDAKRPAETWAARLAWLLASDYLTGLIEDTGYVLTNTVAMDAADYTDGFPSAVMSDLADRTGYNWFAFWDSDVDAVGLFFGHDHDGILTKSTLSISNVVADIDSDYVFAPDPGARLAVTPTETYSEVVVNYAHGTKRLFRSRASTAAKYIRRGTTIERPYTGGLATASAQAEQYLDMHSVEVDRITVTIIVPRSRVGLLVAGQLIDVKFSHLTGYTSDTTMRCVRLTVTPTNDLATHYSMAMELLAPRAVVDDCDMFQKYYDFQIGFSSLGTEHWADGNEHSWFGVPGNWSQNNEAYVHFSEPTSPYAPHPVTFQSMRVLWHYGGAYDINGAPSAASGAAAAFAFDVSTGDETGPWTEILAEADPVTLAGVTYPDDFELVFVLPSPVTAEWIQFRSTGAGNNDLYEIYLCEAADTEIELPPPPNAPITSTADPTAADGAPLPVGQTWINTTTGEVFVLVDNTAGAAVWVSTTASGVADHGALTGLADDDHTQYVLKRYGGKEVVSTVAASGATETLDLASGNVHDLTLTADCTLTFTGATNGVACSFTLVLRQDGTGGWTTTWPGSVVWAGGTAPVLDETASTTAVLTFFTLDGGTVWYGFPTGAGGVSGGTPALTFGTTNAAGAAATAILTDATLAIFDATVPTTAAASDAAATGSAAFAARRDHRHGMPAFAGELLVADTTGGASGVNDSAYVEMTTQRTTTSASLVDITGATTTITLTRAADVAVWMTCHVSAGATCDLGLAISIDGTDHDITDTHLTATDEGNVVIIHRSATAMAPGTYTVKGRFRRTSGGGTPAVDRADLLVMSMGQGGPIMLVLDDGSDFIYADV